MAVTPISPDSASYPVLAAADASGVPYRLALAFVDAHRDRPSAVALSVIAIVREAGPIAGAIFLAAMELAVAANRIPRLRIYSSPWGGRIGPA